MNEDKQMRLSARNQIKGKIKSITPGAVSTVVKIDIGNGNVITSSITNEAAQELGLKKGRNVIAVIKASDVMVGVK
jgi:molybdopterin-binding protein